MLTSRSIRVRGTSVLVVENDRNQLQSIRLVDVGRRVSRCLDSDRRRTKGHIFGDLPQRTMSKGYDACSRLSIDPQRASQHELLRH